MKITEQIDNLSKNEESSFLTMDYEKFTSIFGENFSEKVYETKRSSLTFYYLFFEEDEELYYTIFHIGPSKDNTDLYHVIGEKDELYCKIKDSIIEELIHEEYRIENEVAQRLALIKELTSHPSVRLKSYFSIIQSKEKPMKITEKLNALGNQMTNGSNVFKEEKLEEIFSENYQEQMYHSDSKYVSFYYLFFEEGKEMYYIHFYKVPTLNDSKIFQFIGNSVQLYSKVNGEVIDEMLKDEEKAQARLSEKRKVIENNQKKLKDQLSDSLFYELFKEDVRMQKELERKLALIKKVTDHPSVRLKKLFNPRGGMENEKR